MGGCFVISFGYLSREIVTNVTTYQKHIDQASILIEVVAHWWHPGSYTCIDKQKLAT